MRVLLVTCVSIATLCLGIARAAVSTADLEILTIKHDQVEGSYICEVTIRNISDDSGTDVNLIVLLPNHVTVHSIPADCRKGAPVGRTPWHGFVACTYKTLPPEATCKNCVSILSDPASPEARVRSCKDFATRILATGAVLTNEICEGRARRNIVIKASMPEGDAARLPKICGAFVWSRTGDHVRTNNFKTSAEP